MGVASRSCQRQGLIWRPRTVPGPAGRHGPCPNCTFLLHRPISASAGGFAWPFCTAFRSTSRSTSTSPPSSPGSRRADWEHQPSRVDASTDILLDLLERHGARGTFFVVGWLADRNPGLVRRIAAAGHEIASHSWWHRRVQTTDPVDVPGRRDAHQGAAGGDLRRTGALDSEPPAFPSCRGWSGRSTSCSKPDIRYDSSVFPIRRPGYGWPGAPTVPYDIVRPSGTLREYPMTTLDLLGLRIPAAGGGYLRQLPLGLIRRAFRAHERAGVRACSTSTRGRWIPASHASRAIWLTRLRHYRGLERTLPRLERLLARVPVHLGCRGSRRLNAASSVRRDGRRNGTTSSTASTGWTHFHLSGWREVMRTALGHETIDLAVRDEGALKGVLPLVRVRSALFGHYLVSMPFVNYGGPLGAPRRSQALASEADARWRRPAEHGCSSCGAPGSCRSTFRSRTAR